MLSDVFDVYLGDSSISAIDVISLWRIGNAIVAKSSKYFIIIEFRGLLQENPERKLVGGLLEIFLHHLYPFRGNFSRG